MNKSGMKILVENNGVELRKYETGECRLVCKTYGTCSHWLSAEDVQTAIDHPEALSDWHLDCSMGDDNE